VGADLKLVVNMAVSTALRRAQRATPPPTEESSSAADAAAQGEWCVEFSDLLAASRRVKPSALRETVVEVPEVRWGDIGGQEEAKAALQEAVEWPLRFPEAFKTLGIRPPAGVLLYGPPGCSKTLTAKALATESGLNFLAVKGPELFRKYVGDSEKAIAAVLRKARVAAPAVIFFDEIDALAPRRSSAGEGSAGQRVVSQLLNEMDGVEPLKQVVVVAATNRPDMLDAAFLRPGSIDRLIYVEPPELAARKQILSIHLGKMPLSADVDLSEVDMDALRSALSSCTPRITPEMLAFYSKFRSSNTVSI
jgi:SpoVK/Ycf46/Vps4 family AAA+-type ATPase